jgi:hypothetical protein
MFRSGMAMKQRNTRFRTRDPLGSHCDILQHTSISAAVDLVATHRPLGRPGGLLLGSRREARTPSRMLYRPAEPIAAATP